MSIIGVGALVSKGQFDFSSENINELFPSIMKQIEFLLSSEELKSLNIHITKADYRNISLRHRFQLLSVNEGDFQTITSAGQDNVARYMAKYILGIDEAIKLKNTKINLKTITFAWEKSQHNSPWGKDVYACVWYE